VQENILLRDVAAFEDFVSTETSRTERWMGVIFLSSIFLSDRCDGNRV